VVPLTAILAASAGIHTPASASQTRPTPAVHLAGLELAQLNHAGSLGATSALQGLRAGHQRSIPHTTKMLPRAGQAPPAVHFAVAHAASTATGNDLALPDSYVAGSGTQMPVGSGQGPFTAFHTSWTGFSSGVQALFNFEPIIDLFYQGSVFTTSAYAQAYMNDSYNHLTAGNSIPPTDCSSTVGYPCKIIGYTTVNNLVALYSVAQINYCVIETGYQGPADQIQANSDKVATVAANTFVLGINAAKAACTATTATPGPTTQPTQTTTSIEVLGCFQKKGTKPSANPTCLHSTKHGKKVELEVYTTVQSAPVGSTGNITATVKRGSTTVESGTSTFTTDSGDDVYVVGETWSVPKKKGTYTLKVQTSMNGVTASDTEKLKVT
jgi:hypothetical protein